MTEPATIPLLGLGGLALLGNSKTCKRCVHRKTECAPTAGKTIPAQETVTVSGKVVRALPGGSRFIVELHDEGGREITAALSNKLLMSNVAVHPGHHVMVELKRPCATCGEIVVRPPL